MFNCMKKILCLVASYGAVIAGLLFCTACSDREKYIALNESQLTNKIPLAQDYHNLGLLYDEYNNLNPSIENPSQRS